MNELELTGVSLKEKQGRFLGVRYIYSKIVVPEVNSFKYWNN
jgi:hypothetical protein